MRIKDKISLALLVIAITSCSNSRPGSRIDKMVRAYARKPEDSLKLEAALFLKEQLNQQCSERSFFYNEETGKTVAVNLDTVNGDTGLLDLLLNRKLSVHHERLPDREIMSDTLLATHIDAYGFYIKTWPWNRKADKQTLLNYLLAYKVYDEEPQGWRTYFFREEQDFLKKVLASYRLNLGRYDKNPMTIASQLMSMAGNWYTYDDASTGGMAFEMMKCQRKGDCYLGAHIGVYVLRSFGIPAALDYVPIWGSKNGGHVEVAALDSNGKISAIPGHELAHAAKVFRMSFIPVNLWRDSIKPLMGRDTFLLSNVVHDHSLDVTAVHTNAADIEVILPEKTDKKIAYICVYNYGKWQPVYWGRIADSNRACFRQMGKDVLYYAALPDKDGFRLTGSPFLLDTSGRKIMFIPDKKKATGMTLSKLNTGSGSWVKKGRSYVLYCMNSTGSWQRLSDLACIRDSILTVENMPSKGLYRLVEKGGKGQLERPFGYHANKQIWW
ncbi:hypothetical protein FHW36_104104 [Chitinophaga polysaccharea]|uniref:Transglutaminase superfamily protein n=1 Tax=Chitinophaga polysaccharea TaxID=1293035 RepID=A0A561PQN6_9BACT|nr:hypothetical protein [Chitinophaga polysaccharea]TWF40422.1 hypothetical protein FHW36_104104 [Chitinophaga polysaccharea]